VGRSRPQLALEVSEHAWLRDLNAALATLTRLSLKRVGLVIDNFGIGHASLTQLRDMPFDGLKIDRSFVHGAATDEALKAILLPSLAMANQLGLSTLAQGVEDAADWRFMRSVGCHQAQGFFIAKPMLAAEVLPWFEQWRGRCGALLT
jgi:EAL domain-containing protein (putative c-di-GMP-specific phosphodiesterase class I)